METLNELIAIVFVGSSNNNMEGEVAEVAKFTKHAIEEHLALEKKLKDLKKQCGKKT
jgi:hypothetical protein